MAVIGIAGMPGSGKTRLLGAFRARGFVRFDNINCDWNRNLPRTRTAARQGHDVAIADIVFCDAGWRERLEREIGTPVRWVFFENTPWRCAANCLYRAYWVRERRPVLSEMRKIVRLSTVYRPEGDVRPVVCPGIDVVLPQRS